MLLPRDLLEDLFDKIENRKNRKPSAPREPDERELTYVDGLAVSIRRVPYRRSISLTLRVNGEICASAPRSTPVPRIHDFVRAQREWIATHLRRYEELRRAHPEKRFVEGEKFPFLGREIALRFAPALGDKQKIFITENELIAQIPASRWPTFDRSVAHPEAAPAIVAHYKSAGRDVLEARARVLAERMNAKPSAITLRSQKTRWGSCTARGRVSLNWRLVFAPIEAIDYVIIHEFSHLVYYNHSHRFWSLVGVYAPEYERWREWLRAHQYDADFLAKKSELHGDD